jgi:hypothetical protein
VVRTGEPGDGSVPVDDGAEAEAEERGAPTAGPGNEPAGTLADPTEVPRIDERAGDGNAPVGDGAENRDENAESSFDREAVDPGGRDPAGAAARDRLTSATVAAFA